jgi:perosamine synthetase
MVSDQGSERDESLIRLGSPSVGAEEAEAISQVLQTGFLVQGERVRAFEGQIAAASRTSDAVVVSSGTAALHLALLAAGVGPGDSVAVPTYSWPATANAVGLCGAQPLFVDIDDRTFNMDPERLADALRPLGRIKAIMPVHGFGGMADMPAILDVATRHDACVIEDAACALGASLQSRPAGAWGLLGCFSFHPRKVITTGEGGAVTTSQPELAHRLRTLRNHGLDPLSPTPEFVSAGFNYRLTEFQAAMGLVQMERLSELVGHRRRAAEEYDRLLEGTGIRRPLALEPSAHIYQAYVVMLPRAAADRQPQIIFRLRSRSIEVGIGTYHVPLTRFWAQQGGYTKGDFPVTDDVAKRAIALPMHSKITVDEQRRVVVALLEEASIPSDLAKAT